ncbi:hypothetical protein [Aureimonas sp. AU40]|uniref:hypothetical protein n=1 Tax=Aureimonas sp. AU40 TaxID=1637747 RepID=UPI0007812584|nr:hypothetical protein [Aureimonas sp. AU40]
MADNIDTAAPDADPVDEKATRKAKRLEDAKARSAASRLARKRSLPADLETVHATVVLCLLDLVTLPPSRRAGRAEVIGDVTRQVLRTLTAMGHPDVHGSWLAMVEATKSRLETERWHHPLSHRPFARPPADTPVTPTACSSLHSDRIVESTGETDRVRTG